jgi:hypothetical protein
VAANSQAYPRGGSVSPRHRLNRWRKQYARKAWRECVGGALITLLHLQHVVNLETGGHPNRLNLRLLTVLKSPTSAIVKFRPLVTCRLRSKSNGHTRIRITDSFNPPLGARQGRRRSISASRNQRFIIMPSLHYKDDGYCAFETGAQHQSFRVKASLFLAQSTLG